MRRLYLVRALVFVVAAIALSMLRTPLLHAQAATLSGLITSETGQVLESANAFITELNISVPTSAQGRYSVTIPAERVRGQSVTLRIRAIGHLAQAKAPTFALGNVDEDFLKRTSIVFKSRRHRRDRCHGAEEDDIRSDLAQPRRTSSSSWRALFASIAGKVPGATVVGANGRWYCAVDRACAERTRSMRRTATRARWSSSTVFCSTAAAPTSIRRHREHRDRGKYAAGASIYGSCAPRTASSRSRRRSGTDGARPSGLKHARKREPTTFRVRIRSRRVTLC